MGIDTKPLFPTFSIVKGKHLPTPVFRSISIRNPAAEVEGAEFVDDIKISSNLSIVFTRPKEETDIERFLKAYFDKLYLYVYTSLYSNINDALENGNLNLKDLFNTFADHGTTAETFYGPGHLAGTSAATPTFIYDQVIEFMKYFFLAYVHTTWSSAMALDTDTGHYLNLSKDRIAMLLDNPSVDAIDGLGVNIMYALFWGTAGEKGPWVDDGERDIAAEAKAYLEDEDIHGIARGVPAKSFMRDYLPYTLAYFRGGYSDEYVISKVSLKSLLGRDDVDVIDSEEYDSEGNAIVKIENIQIQHYLRMTDARMEARVKATPKIFNIAFIGLDIDAISDKMGRAGSEFDEGLDTRITSPGWGTPHIVETETTIPGIGTGIVTTVEFGAGETNLMPRRSLINSYFGNIVYEHILENGKVPDNPTEAYYRNDGTQYPDVAIEAWNSRYYVNEPISREDLIKRMKQLIKSYELQRDNDEVLDSNLKNLEFILQTYKNSSNILNEFRNYIRTYQNKSPISNSGKFYNNFKLAATDFNKSIMTQEEVVKRLYKSTVVYDSRDVTKMGIFEDFSYAVPWIYEHATGADPFFTGAFASPGSGFIPESWFTYTSNVVLRKYGDSIHDTERKQNSEWWNYYEILVSALTDGPHDLMPWGDDSITYRTDWATYVDRMSAADQAAIAEIRTQYITRTGGSTTDGTYGDLAEHEYLTWEDITNRAMIQTNRYFAANSEYTILGLHDYVTGGYANGAVYSMDFNGDRTVINQGWFMFDYEKALITRSALSEFVSPAALHRFLGYRVPYEHFFVVAATLIRNGVQSPYTASDKTRLTLECRMIGPHNDFEPTSGAPKYPQSSYSVWQSEGNESFAANRFQYYTPGGNWSISEDGTATGVGTITNNSFLKFINFDVMNGDVYTGLKTLRNYAPTSPEFPFTPIALGSRVAGDYRFMTFQFRDAMDDDTAFYNFVAGHKPADDRSTTETTACNALVTINDRSEPFSQYEAAVLIEDRSLDTLHTIYVGIVEPMITRFEEYLDFCEELCSFNNIENRFNTFFANGMEARYNVGSAPEMTTFAGPPDPQPPWFEIPYFISAFQRTFGEQYYTDHLDDFGQEEKILKNAIEISKLCNPRTGTLDGVESVLEMLRECGKVLTLENTDAYAQINTILNTETTGESGFMSDITTSADLLGKSYSMTTQNQMISPGPNLIGGSVPTRVAVFTGRIDIDQPIFGDVILDGIDLRMDIEDMEGPVIPVDPKDPAGYDTSCFVAGTKVKMYDGTEKNIENVEIGDILLGENNSPNTVLEFDHPMLGSRQLYSINDSKPFITKDHPIKSTTGWKAIYPEGTEHIPRVTIERFKDHGVKTTQLCLGDNLIRFGNKTEKITQLLPHDAPNQRIYNFVLDGNHTYYADGYLVHNACEGGGGGYCFVAGTKVTAITESGISQVNIEELKVGDQVLTYNFENQQTEPANIISTMSPRHDDIVEFVFSNGTRTKHTHDHPYYVASKGWCSYQPELTKQRYKEKNPELSEILSIELGDLVMLSSGENTELVQINLIDSDVITTYNINVDLNSNYFADDILVHNKGGGGGVTTPMKMCWDGSVVPITSFCPPMPEGGYEVDWSDIELPTIEDISGPSGPGPAGPTPFDPGEGGGGF